MPSTKNLLMPSRRSARTLLKAQAPYQKALDDAVAAVKADQEAYTAAQKAVEALSVPSVKATWEAEPGKDHTADCSEQDRQH